MVGRLLAERTLRHLTAPSGRANFATPHGPFWQSQLCDTSRPLLAKPTLRHLTAPSGRENFATPHGPFWQSQLCDTSRPLLAEPTLRHLTAPSGRANFTTPHGPFWQRHFPEPHVSTATCSAYSYTLKIEAVYSSETSVDFQRTIRRYIPENSTLQQLYSTPLFPFSSPKCNYSSNLYSQNCLLITEIIHSLYYICNVN
jgi:hypothetical protein